MILVDANLLIYASLEEVPQHQAAKSWLEARLNGEEDVGLPWPALLAFVRIAANPKIFDNAIRLTDAWVQVEDWLSLDNVWVPSPTDLHQRILAPLIERIGNNVNLLPDAHLAALAIEHGLTLYSADRDFARFADLDWVNPLEEEQEPE